MISIIEDGKINWRNVGLLAGYVFFALMIFSKAVGLDSSNKAYYVFAAIAAIFWGVECLFYKFSKHQFIFSAFIMIIAMATVISVHKPGFILTMMAVAALRNMDREKLLKVYLYTWVIGLLIIAILVSAGLVEDICIIDPRGYLRHGAGFCTGNCYHSAFVILFGLYFYYRKGNTKWWEFVTAECINIAVFYFSGSYTGTAIGIILPLAMYIVSKIDGYVHKSSRYKVFFIYATIVCVFMVAVVAISFIWPMINKDIGKEGIFYTFVQRLRLSYAAMCSYPVTPFGFRDFGVMLDNAYVYILYQYGVIPFILVISLYTTAIVSIFKRRDIYSLTIIAIFVAYGFMEQFFNAAFMNFTWLIVGHEVMNVVLPKLDVKLASIIEKVKQNKYTISN